MNNTVLISELDDSRDRDKLFNEHVPLVKTIAHHISVRLPPGKSVDDLIQVGLIGLLEAVKVYEPTQGAEFKSYASIRIRGAILDELRRETWVPRSVQQKSRQLSTAITEVENRLGRTASDVEIAEELDLSQEDYQDLLETVASCSVFSLDDENTFVQLASDEDDVLNDIHYASVKAKLAESIGQLPKQEKLVVALYYDYGLNLREIGEALSVSESRACQVLSQATSRLRTKVQTWLGDIADL